MSLYRHWHCTLTASPLTRCRPCPCSSDSSRNTTDKDVCAEALAKAIDLVRDLPGYPLCQAAKEHWGRCSSSSVAQLAVGLMSDEAKAAVATRGSSVVQDAPNIQSGDSHDGPGLYLQVVANAAGTTLCRHTCIHT